RGAEIQGGPRPCLSCPGRLLSFASQVGNGLHTQNTGGKSTSPIHGGNPEKGLCGLSAGFFSGEQPGVAKAVDCRTSIRNSQIGKESEIDRKSTRLNSSHVSISYAVFCLKKKKIKG